MHRHDRIGWRTGRWWRCSIFNGIDPRRRTTPRPASLGCGQQLREHGEVVPPSGGEGHRRVHVDADRVPARREPQLALAREQHVPRLVLLQADQGMLAIGAALSVRSCRAVGAGQAVVAAGSAVFGPPASLEVPAAESPDPFFAAFSRTWRRVNS